MGTDAGEKQMRKEIVWRESKEKYGPGRKLCYIGNICVGDVTYNSLKSKSDIGIDYVWTCYLPGLQRVSKITTPTEADGIHAVQNTIDAWFQKVLNKS